MKLAVISPDARGRIDGTNKHTLLDQLPLASTVQRADATIIPISFFPDFVFNPELEKIRGPAIVIDYTEYGHAFWTPDRRSHIFGDGELPEYLMSNPEWARLDAFLAAHPPALTFKRELLAADAGPRVRPIEFVCTLPASGIESKAEFDARPFEVCNVWGYSHPARPRLHGEIFAAMGDRGINVLSDWCQMDTARVQSRTWVSIYSPWWVRQPLSRVMDIQRCSKLSVSMPGAGQKCFRSSESPVDCIMAMQDDRLAWSYPWLDGENCIRLRPGHEFDGLMDALSTGVLYDIYRESQVNIDRYRTANYIERHVMAAIRECI